MYLPAIKVKIKLPIPLASENETGNSVVRSRTVHVLILLKGHAFLAESFTSLQKHYHGDAVVLCICTVPWELLQYACKSGEYLLLLLFFPSIAEIVLDTCD